MVDAIDMIGKRFGRLVCIGRAGSVYRGQAAWLWQCDCGNQKVLSGSNVRRGNTTSCGCVALDVHTIHNKSRTRTYRIWCGMRLRCRGTGRQREKTYYSGRGISVCPRWSSDFNAFLMDMGECPPGLTIDRINNDGNYEPGNCRWATRLDQSLNSRQAYRIAFNDEILCLREACAKSGISYGTVRSRIFRRGMTAQEAFDLGIRT